MSEKGKMTVAEAGRKGGSTTKARHGASYYAEIGHRGGQKVKELIAVAKKMQSENN